MDAIFPLENQSDKKKEFLKIMIALNVPKGQTFTSFKTSVLQ